jgi:predicted nucleic acid-binding protein
LLVGDVVDRPLYEEILAAGLKKDRGRSERQSDALHLMYAVHDQCEWFVTLDPDFHDIRAKLEPLCRGLRIVTPGELEADLSSNKSP